MASKTPISEEDMRKGVKKPSLLSKIAKKKNSQNDSTGQSAAGSIVDDKPIVTGQILTGSSSMIVPGHATKGSDPTNMSRTTYCQKDKDSRASKAIHGSFTAQPLDQPEKLHKTHEEQRQAPVSSTLTHPTKKKNETHSESGNRPSANKASPKLKDSKTKTKMCDDERENSTRVLVTEQDTTPNETRPKMSVTLTDINFDVSNLTLERESGKALEPEQASRPKNTKSTLPSDQQQEDSKHQVNSRDVANRPLPPKPSSEKSEHEGASKSRDVNSSSNQTSQSKSLRDPHASNSKESGDASSIPPKCDSKQQTTPLKSSTVKSREKTQPETEDPDVEKPKHPPRHIFVNATKAEIADLDVDVIVSSEDAALQGFGMVAKQLRKKGGEQYEQHKMVARSIIGDLKAWHFVFTPGRGSLKCKNVAHVNIPRIEEIDQEAWCRYFSKLLGRLMKRVDCMGFTSMAIPLLGTGRNGAPTDFVIDLLCSEILKFSQNPADKIWLQTIYIVHPDSKTVKSIETVVRRLCLGRTPEVIQKSNVAKSKSKTRQDESVKDDLSFIERYSVKPLMAESSPEELCPICMDKVELKDRVELNRCHHVFCLTCIQHSFTVKPACPLCNTVYGIVRGIQPKGYMVEVFRKEPLPGFDGCGIIHIYYSFLDGIQNEEHPNPGKPYRGTKREAFLPDNREGQRVHRLLRKSFEQKLTFTIGSSRTTGREGVVTWNDIHHKTRVHGGPERFGYPDPLYLKRVEEELAAKGISEADDSV